MSARSDYPGAAALSDAMSAGKGGGEAARMFDEIDRLRSEVARLTPVVELVEAWQRASGALSDVNGLPDVEVIRRRDAYENLLGMLLRADTAAVDALTAGEGHNTPHDQQQTEEGT